MTGRKIIAVLVAVSISLFIFTDVSADTPESAVIPPFSDVPADSYAYKDILDLRELGITNGTGNNLFGYNQSIKRAEFITFLYRLMKWEDEKPAMGSFTDNQDSSKYYYIPVETALKKGVITNETGPFRPMESATREEMAVMLVRCLGYDTLAKMLASQGSPFTDVTENPGYITIAKDFGIITGTGNGFNPNGTAKKEQAAAMMMRMYNRLNIPVSELNVFYAISSNDQASLIPNIDTLSCGWSSLEYDKETDEFLVNTSRILNGNLQDYYLPQGFSGRIDTTRQSGVPALLMVYGTQDNKVLVDAEGTAVSTADVTTGISSVSATGILEYVLTNSDLTAKAIDEICALAANASRRSSDGTITESATFDGVVIDFESMKGAELKAAFSSFLEKLREKLPAGSKLYVTVHPLDYYDAYDYKRMGEIADKVILMAHDYNTKGPISEADMARGFDGNPPAPANEVYKALQKITDPMTGVSDKSKIELQISFGWVEWLTKDGITLKNKPGNYSMDNFMELFTEYTPSIKYSELFKSPYMEFTDEEGIEHTVWYEDSRSVEEKFKMAQMFGIHGISLWRLGNIPEYTYTFGVDIYQEVWDKIMDIMGR